MRSLAEWMVEVRRPKAVARSVDEAVDAAIAPLRAIAEAHPIRFHSDSGWGGEMSARARELVELLEEDRRMRAVRHDQAADNLRRARAGNTASALDNAYGFLPSSHKPAAAQYFAFQAIDAGLDAKRIAMFEALVHWGYFEGLTLEVAATYPLYTDRAPRSASDAPALDKAVGRWAEASRALRLPEPDPE